MNTKRENLVFGGGGILGIAYLGVLEYLYQTGNFRWIKRVAGTSAGAITACLTSFRLPFYELRKISATLDYKKVPGKELFSDSNESNPSLLKGLEGLFDDYTGVYRLLTNYGWFSSAYLYQWLQEVIAAQFDPAIKKPPYTFADFRNTECHIQKREFLDLYITGTSLSYRSSRVFSYESTPEMEVAKAVRISMSIPLFFESVKIKEEGDEGKQKDVFCDGGIMWNYPIQLFDSERFLTNKESLINHNTLGIKFLDETKYHDIDSLLSYIKNMYLAQMHVQQDIFKRSPEDVERTILIDPGTISAIDFDVETGDEKYKFLYRQGYEATRIYYRNMLMKQE